MGTGELRRIHSRVSWMFLPVERSMTVSAPQRDALADGDEFHLGRDPPTPCVMQLGHAPAGRGAQRSAHAGETNATERGVALALAAVLRAWSGKPFHVRALENPGQPERRQALLDIRCRFRIGVGAARVVEADRSLAAGEVDFSHG